MLQEARLRAGMSQGQLSEAADVPKQTLQHYEQGVKDINGAKIKTLCKIALALNCPIFELLTDQETIAMLKKVKR